MVALLAEERTLHVANSSFVFWCIHVVTRKSNLRETNF